ncbi:amino acid ABC transporter substrate-binding protein [Bacterioplanes sanyensis]|uniref:Amino acid ABC transporter substrate-binding protein n=1 Tax=Bacterioplanes sanyensis TaxID=1249553 RepID=A0A222FPE8_9GAMM|nr:transporter substrate-binding domain-containing protein [Bacterioplanes sanyensis]ASP40649.1 amino acid ABC transporter substrate-binding protein [Bacterioplanes sanyensis]
MRMLILITSLILWSCNSLAETVTAAQDPWPPFVQEGNPPGISVEVVQEAMKTQGYTVDMKLTPWARAIEDVKNGNVDFLIGTWFTQERSAYLRYSDHYAINQVKFITKADSSFEYTGMDSLAGKSVGIVRGYGYGDEFLTAGHFARPEANNLVLNLRKLMAGRIDMTLEDEIVARSQMTGAGLDVSQFRFTSNSLSENKLHVTSGLANARSEELINAFNKGLAAIKANGTFDAIMKKYGI